MVEVDKGIFGPQFLLQFLARDHLAGLPQQERQNLERLPAQLEPHPVFPKFMRIQIRFEWTEPYSMRI